MKFLLGTDLGSAVPPTILTLTITMDISKLIRDQHLGATTPYTSLQCGVGWGSQGVTERHHCLAED